MDASDVHCGSTVVVSCDLGYSDEILHGIGRMMPFDWKKLGVYLGITLMRLDQMTKVKYPHEMALEMLQQWWHQSTPHSRWGELHHGLVSIHRHDLLKESQAFCKNQGLDYNCPNQVTIDRLLFMLAESITLVWKDLGLYLDVPTQKLSEIGQQPVQDTSQHCFKVLKMWQVLPDASHHQLIRVLADDMKRGDIMRYLLKQFEKPRRGRVVCDCSECDA